MFQLLTAASPFSSVGAKTNVLNQVNHDLITCDNMVQQLLEAVGKFLLSICPFDTQLHVPSPPSKRNKAPCAVVLN